MDNPSGSMKSSRTISPGCTGRSLIFFPAIRLSSVVFSDRQEGFSERGAKQAIESFRDALNTAGADGKELLKGQEGVRVEESNPASNGAEKLKRQVATRIDVDPEERTVSQALPATHKKVYSWGLSAAVFATMEIHGDPELDDLLALRDSVDITIKGLERSRNRCSDYTKPPCRLG
jgi:hypothetical protein